MISTWCMANLPILLTANFGHREDVAITTMTMCKLPALATDAQQEIVLLDHKFRRWFSGIRRVQHWHRCRVAAIATANRRWMVAIEFGTWRWGRIGGAAGSVTTGNGRFFDCSGAIRSRGGNPLPFGDYKTVGCDRHRAVVVKASPSASLIVAEADFLLELLIIALDSPAQFGEIDEVAERHVVVDGCEPEFRGRGFILARRAL
jgi:hypothetical protein